ncbi:MAG TPA: bifunctional hydroxymethylpyrimidine kinase/phosphomethylpyrimidine kinase [Polyangia bacterium]|nr:bifunctional hydroxymethylpyrimidine kinase/phosphomethylpyrimidine kinase [Polyangia bacterium]
MTAPERGAGQPPRTVVVVGGVDPGGGAGLLRDVRTARALGVQAHAIGTAWTEQADGVHRVEPREPGAVGQAVARAVADLDPIAVKIGMAVGPATAAALLTALTGFAGPVVVDPVLATSRGGLLWEGEPAGLLPLLRRASLVTPNAPEAAALAGRPVADLQQADAAGRVLIDGLGLRAVLVKGGHLGTGEDPVSDLLVTAETSRAFRHARAAGVSPRGTGCALATALAVALGCGEPLEAAVQTATTWLAGAIAGAVPAPGGERHLGS